MSREKLGFPNSTSQQRSVERNWLKDWQPRDFVAITPEEIARHNDEKNDRIEEERRRQNQVEMKVLEEKFLQIITGVKGAHTLEELISLKNEFESIFDKKKNRILENQELYRQELYRLKNQFFYKLWERAYRLAELELHNSGIHNIENTYRNILLYKSVLGDVGCENITALYKEIISKSSSLKKNENDALENIERILKEQIPKRTFLGSIEYNLKRFLDGMLEFLGKPPAKK